jgi:hypothetical protein
MPAFVRLDGALEPAKAAEFCGQRCEVSLNAGLPVPRLRFAGS